MLLKSGDILTLEDLKFRIVLKFLVECVPVSPLDSSTQLLIMLAPMEYPYDRLHIFNDGVKFKNSTPNKDNILCLDSSNEDFYTVHTYNKVGRMKNSEKANKSAIECDPCESKLIGSNEKYISIDSLGNLHSVSIESLISESSLLDKINQSYKFRVVPSTSSSLQMSHCIASRDKKFLAIWQLRRFVHEGYLHLQSKQRALVDESLINEASRFLSHYLGKVNTLIPGSIQGEDFGKFPGTMSNHPIIRSLLTPILESVVSNDLFSGQGVYNIKNLSAQVAFRFPEYHSVAAPEIEWHTDGMRQGYSHPFSLLVGVCLSPVRSLYCGNLTVWPGSHLLLYKCKNHNNGSISCESLTRSASGNAANQDSSDCCDTEKIDDSTLADGKTFIGPHLQLMMEPGDVVLLHPDLAHNGAPNLSSTTRQMIYFRVKINYGGDDKMFESWEEIVEKHRTCMWIDLPGIKGSLQNELLLADKIYSTSTR